MKRIVGVISLLFLVVLVLYFVFSAYKINQVPSPLLINYAINPKDMMRDEGVYFPGIANVLVWRIENLEKEEIDRVVNHPTITPYVVLSLAYSYPENNEEKFKRSVVILEMRRSWGLSLYKPDSNNCSSVFAAMYPLENNVRHMNDVEREGHRKIAGYLKASGDASRFKEVDEDCSYTYKKDSSVKN